MAKFATLLRKQMIRQKKSASDVARAVWGTAKDKRGYEVAKNRDRIGHYLNGSFPTPRNLVKICNFLKIDPVDMYDIQPTPHVRRAKR